MTHIFGEEASHVICYNECLKTTDSEAGISFMKKLC